jgi:hypothetical protein
VNGRAARSSLVAAGGPILIVGSVLIVLHGFWLGPKLTNQHVDILSFWFPRWCFLGHSLSSGHVPTWLPYQAGGVPFASDPQSGWLYAPVMLLFSQLSCTRAMGLMVVLSPVLAGLGMYLFFRHEGLRRAAATVGGLTLALPMAGSVVALTMPFAATLGWTAMALGGASGYLHARTPIPILGWLAFTAFALSQVAAAHLTNGLLIAGIELGLYVLLRSILQVRAHERPVGLAVLMGVGLFAAFPLLAAAVFVPRLALLPRTSLGHGYLDLARIATQLSGARAPTALATHGLSPWWGTAFARGPAGYVGALGILLIPVALSSPRRWLPAAGFVAAGVIGWLVNLDALVGSKALRSVALRTPLGELWLRDPGRFRYLLLFAFAATAGYGLQAWLDRGDGAWRDAARRALWLAPAIVLFAAPPILTGSPKAPYLVFGVACVVAIPLLVTATRSRAIPAAALVAFVAVELTAAGLIGQSNAAPGTLLARAQGGSGGFAHAFPSIHPAAIEPAAYTTPGNIGRTLIADRGSFGRYFSFDPEISRRRRAFLNEQGPGSWPAYENGRSVLFGIDEIQGYLPVQLDRYWRLVRRVDPVPLQYNHAAFQSIRPDILDLFGVQWIIQRTALDPPPGSSPVTDEGRYTLYRVTAAEPRASLVGGWRVMSSRDALEAVVQESFDPAQEAIVEATPAVGGSPLPTGQAAGATVTYTEPEPEHVVVRVDSTSGGLLVVRNAYDRNWHATVDGHPVRVLVTDYMMQGVALPPGSHVVELRYQDRAIGVGLLLSGLFWGALLVAVALLLLAARRSRGAPSSSPHADGGEIH